MNIAFHPLANIFPLLDGAEFDLLAADIKARGLRQVVTLFEGLVLDGRNRARACEVAGVDCRYETLPDDIDPVGFVISMNVPRRHLTDGQRAYVAAKLASIGWGGDRSKSPNGDLTTKQAAERLHVAERAVERARIVRDKATIELQSALERGLIPVATAAGLAVLSEADQREVLQGDPNSISRRALALIKKRHRSAREIDLGKKQRALPTEKFGVIVADPEWRFEPWSRETGLAKAADNHYPTSCTEVIAARPVQSIAAPDCVLFLWATAPMLPHALLVMSAWGFDYVSNYVWDKVKVGTGYWNRNVHEHLLIGTKGKIVAPAMGDQWNSIIEARATKHSAKPERFLEMIEGYFPTLPKMELNRRGPARKGWSAWGNQAEEFDPATGEVSEHTEASPSSEPSPGAAPQSEAPHAGTGSGTSAGCEADTAGEGANALADLSTPNRENALTPAPAPAQASPEFEDIPECLRRNPDNSLPVASPRPAPSADAGTME